jgi:hypothetical protein
MLSYKIKTKKFSIPQKLILLCLPVLLFFSSCDCYRTCSGTVTDQLTGLPVVGATVYLEEQDYHSKKTDSTGSYTINFIEAGMECRHPTRKKIVIEKEHYKKTIIPGYQEKTQLVRDH